MQIPEEASLLRIFIGENERFEHGPLFEAIVAKAREAGLAGATVLRGPLGYGHLSHLHTEKILRLSDDLPVVIELVDSPEKIEQFAATARPHDRFRADHRRKSPRAPLRQRRATESTSIHPADESRRVNGLTRWSSVNDFKGIEKGG